MKRITERIAYVKGLAEGLNILESSPEGRVLHELISVMDDLASSVSHLRIHQEQVEEYLAAIDEDLT
ncbi:MAG: hypothetical protein JWN30_1744, partial [Bacilli bacterium]|nr:hypothetical protein [Bacilli bacterium]